MIKEDAARFDPNGGRWSANLRLRLFWTLLEETGLRLGEALLLRHGDWHPGTGTTAFVDVQPREDPGRRLRAKNQHYRRVYVSDELDHIYGEYLFLLIDLGVDVADAGPVFVNLFRGQFRRPLRPETVYDWVAGFKRRHPLLPPGWTPHLFRHSHATALLLAGIPEQVMQRRLGHSDINTLMRTYAHVTEDAAMRAAADWKTLVARWGPWRDWRGEAIPLAAHREVRSSARGAAAVQRKYLFLAARSNRNGDRSYPTASAHLSSASSQPASACEMSWANGYCTLPPRQASPRSAPDSRHHPR